MRECVLERGGGGGRGGGREGGVGEREGEEARAPYLKLV